MKVDREFFFDGRNLTPQSSRPLTVFGRQSLEGIAHRFKFYIHGPKNDQIANLVLGGTKAVNRNSGLFLIHFLQLKNLATTTQTLMNENFKQGVMKHSDEFSPRND